MAGSRPRSGLGGCPGGPTPRRGAAPAEARYTGRYGVGHPAAPPGYHWAKKRVPIYGMARVRSAWQRVKRQ